MSLFLLLVTLALVGCDHATKAAAQTALGHRGAVTLVQGVVGLRYAENRDTAFSLLRGLEVPHKAEILMAAALTGVIVLAVTWWRRRRASTIEQTAFALLLAGAVGNAIDRVGRGYVIDFIAVSRWPVFNVADIAVVAGAVLLGILAFTSPRRAEPSSG